MPLVTILQGMLADNAVTSASISAGAIITDKIADGSITNAKLSLTSLLGTNNIADGAITTAKTNFADLTLSGNATVGGNLMVMGSLTALGNLTYLDTVVSVTSALSVINAGTGPALVVRQRGAEPLAQFIDNESGIALFISDTGRIGINTDRPQANLTIIGSTSSVGTFSVQQTLEKTGIAANIVDNIDFDVLSQTVLFQAAPTIRSWSINFRGNNTTTLDSVLLPGQTVTCVHLVSTSTISVFCSAVRVDGIQVVPFWQGNAGAPVAGNINSLDTYTYTIIKVAPSTFRVLASLTQFA